MAQWDLQNDCITCMQICADHVQVLVWYIGTLSVQSIELFNSFAELFYGHPISHAVNNPLHCISFEISKLLDQITVDEVFALALFPFTAE